MNKAQALELIKAIVQEVDYDIYKDLFVNPVDPEAAWLEQERLVTVLGAYIPIKA